MLPAFTFDDVALVPQFNNIPSRTEPNLKTWLTKKLEVSHPLVPANMDSVMGIELARLMLSSGTIPILHRFADLETQRKWVNELKGRVFISAGINKWEDLASLLEEEPLGVCLDVAHGHSQMMIDLIKKIKSSFTNTQVIAGNICTPNAYMDLALAGADAVKVGIGPGAACTTRVVTGCGVPQFSAIQECGRLAEKLRVPIIADGGIKGSREVVLAIAAGASTVMLGKLFALTNESAAQKRTRNHNISTVLEAKYRGQASKDFQDDFYGGLKEKTVAEGTSFWAPVSGSAQNLMDDLLGGLRSGMTYCGARDFKELRRKAEFRTVTSSYIQESHPRK